MQTAIQPKTAIDRAAERQAALVGVWISTAKLAATAESKGVPSNAIALFLENARKRGYSDAEILAVQQRIPAQLAARISLLIDQYRDCQLNEVEFRRRSGAWANPEEVENIVERARAAVSKPSIPLFATHPPDQTPPENNPPTLPGTPPADLLAVRIKELLERCYDVTFDFIEVVKGSRVTEYRYLQRLNEKDDGGKKKRMVPVKTIQENFPDILIMFAGLEKGREPTVSKGYGYFGIQIEKRGWNSDTDYVCISKVLGDRLVYLDLNEPLRLPVGEAVDGTPLFWYPGERGDDHAIVAGQTGAGKTGELWSWVFSIMTQRYPQHVQIAIADPRRLNTKIFEGMPWIWAKKGKIRSTGAEIDELIASLMAELEFREKFLADNDSELIADYNEANPENPLYRLLVMFEEFPHLRKLASSLEYFDESLASLVERAGKVGIHIIIFTQDAAANLSGALTPRLRANLNTKVVFYCAENLSQFVLGNGRKDGFKLAGKGDGLFLCPSVSSTPVRFQAYRTTKKMIADFVAKVRGAGRLGSYLATVRVRKDFIDPPMRSAAPTKEADPFTAPSAAECYAPEPTGDSEMDKILTVVAALRLQGDKAVTATNLIKGVWGDNATTGGSATANQKRIVTILARHRFTGKTYIEAIAALLAVH